MIVFLKTVISLLTSVACFLTSFIFGNFNAGYEPLNDGCNLNFAVISDVHMSDDTARRDILKLGLYDMDSAEEKLDALLISGDMTDHGNSDQYDALAEVFSEYQPADNIVLAMGNHDTWNDEIDDEHEFSQSKKLFIEYNKAIADREIENVYYSTVINGYTFIMMSSEASHTDAYISPEQLAWLDTELAKASTDNKPVFVVSHWPLAGTHGLPLTWLDNPLFEDQTELEENDGSFGAQNDEVKAILQKYNNVFFINGHLHNGASKKSIYGYSSVETVDNITSINLPCYMFSNTKGAPVMGNGFVFEVYDDEVVIRTRNFTGGVWYTWDVYNVTLQ